MTLPSLSVFLFVLFLLTACNGEPMDHYSQDAIDIKRIETISPDSVRVYYTTMLETLYYCPGVNVVEQEDSIAIKFIRCSIKDKCKVSHPVTKDRNGEFVLIENDSKPIYVEGKKAKTQIFPESAG